MCVYVFMHKYIKLIKSYWSCVEDTFINSFISIIAYLKSTLGFLLTQNCYLWMMVILFIIFQFLLNYFPYIITHSGISRDSVEYYWGHWTLSYHSCKRNFFKFHQLNKKFDVYTFIDNLFSLKRYLFNCRWWL